MEVGDLVKQRSVGVAIISEYIRSSLNLGMIGVVKVVHDKTQYSYDGRNRGDITVVWSNGKEETLPEIYLEKVENEE
tara:strand:+ start:1004 stop:1234 length:231 start_codon:yes stop_codon:yes gene_type:complete